MDTKRAPTIVIERVSGGGFLLSSTRISENGSHDDQRAPVSRITGRLHPLTSILEYCTNGRVLLVWNGKEERNLDPVRLSVRNRPFAAIRFDSGDATVGSSNWRIPA